MIDAIGRYIPAGALRFARPRGGLYLWGRVGAGLSTRAVLEQALSNGVAFVPGDAFYADPAGSAELRLCFSSVKPSDIDGAVKKLAISLAKTAPVPRRELVTIS